MILEDAQIDDERKTGHQKESIVMIGDRKMDEQVSMNRKYKVTGLTAQQSHRLQTYRDKYDKYLKVHNNTSQKEVWKIYDHIAAELLKEQLNVVLQDVASKELDKFVEQVLIDEFQCQ